MRTIKEIEDKNLLDLLEAFPIRTELSISTVQWRMGWGFNRTFRTLLKAVELGRATTDERHHQFTLV